MMDRIKMNFFFWRTDPVEVSSLASRELLVNVITMLWYLHCFSTSFHFHIICVWMWPHALITCMCLSVCAEGY